MVDLKPENRGDDAGLFLHVPTGRFRRLRLPVLRDHIILGASDGLIVLGDRDRLYLPRVLNPLTGDMIHFAAPLYDHFGDGFIICTAVSGGSHPTLALWRELDQAWWTVVYADQTSHEFREEYIGPWLTTMVTFQVNIYYAGLDGRVFKFVGPLEPCDHENEHCECDHEPMVIAEMSADLDISLEGHSSVEVLSFLVESAGELLLVRHGGQALKVFRVDVEHKMMKDVRTLGGCRALFVGDERCVSVEADRLPSVQADCVYISSMLDKLYTAKRRGHMYNLRDGTMKIISTETMFRSNNRRLRPLSLIQVLLDYCSDVTLF
jgi:hypothetical protein